MQVSDWLRDIGLGEYAATFEQNAIDWDLLPTLTSEDLTDLGVTALGHRKRFVRAVDKHRAPAAVPETDAATDVGVRRLAAIVFADLTGYTHIAESLDVEELLQLERCFMTVMEGVVDDYGGTVTDRHGDSLIGVFGYPVAHENDVVRAASAALDMHTAMPALTDELRLDLSLEQTLQVHIGMALGEVVPVSSNPDDLSDYRVTGQSLSLAKRLSDTAKPDETLITSSISQLLSGKAKCQPVGDLSLQGFAKPVPVLRLMTLSPDEPGLTKTPFVDRTDEFAFLLELLETCRRKRRSQVITLRGEVGVGKSRLVQEVAQTARARGFAGTRVPILDFGGARRRPVAESLTWRLLGLRSDSSLEARQRTRDQLFRSGEIADEYWLFLDKLLGLPLSNEDASTLEAMDNAARLEGRRASLAQLIRTAAGKQPVLLIIEDMHWADPDYLEEIAALASGFRDAAVTLVVTWRTAESDREADWHRRIQGLVHVTLDLAPLSEGDSETLATNIAEMEPSRVRAVIEQAKGNPLFLEQVVLHAEEVEDGMLLGNAVPDLVTSLVQARMDRLPVLHQRALQAAAVLGQRFDSGSLQHLVEVSDYDCGLLIQKGFLRDDGDELAFAHELVREGVYRSLLKFRRRQLHRTAADWFRHRDLILRAEHLEKAQDASAAEAFYHAAEQSAFDYEYQQALILAERGLEISGSAKNIFDLQYLRGELLALLGRHKKSSEAYENALNNSSDPISHCRVLINIARNYSLLDEPDIAKPILDKAEEIAIQKDDKKFISDIYEVRGGIEQPLGNVDLCIEYIKNAYDLALDSGSAESISRTLFGLGLAYFARGWIRSAQEKFEECISYSLEMDLERTAIQIMHMTAWYKYLSLDPEAGLEVGRQACLAGERIRDSRTVMNGGRMQCYILLEQGRWQEAEFKVEENLRLTRKLRARRFEPVIRAFSARLMHVRGASEEAEREAERAYEISKELHEKFVGPLVLGCYATVAGDPDKQKWALQTGEEILKRGCGSQNYFLFYRDAINVCLRRGDWESVYRFAHALEAYTADQPLRFSDFYVAKARTLAAIGEGHRDPELLHRLEDLRKQAARAGMQPEIQSLQKEIENSPISRRSAS